MDTSNEMSTVCAAFSETRDLEKTYVDLVGAGLSPTDVSVLVTEATHAHLGAQAEGIMGQLAPVQGGFTGGIGVRAAGPARSFGVMGSVATGLIGSGIDDREAAWLMNALVEGLALLLVHGHSSDELERAREVFAAHAASRFA